MNLCRSCGEDFATLTAFDEHRTGVHTYTFDEGSKMDPPVDDGRRCLETEELRDWGWSQNAKGQWHYPSDWVMQAWKWNVAVPDAEEARV